MGHFLPLTNEPSPEEEDDADDSEVRDTFMVGEGTAAELRVWVVGGWLGSDGAGDWAGSRRRTFWMARHAARRAPCLLALVLQEYKPAKLSFGRPHPDAVVETASLAAVEPPDITYHLKVWFCCIRWPVAGEAAEREQVLALLWHDGCRSAAPTSMPRSLLAQPARRGLCVVVHRPALQAYKALVDSLSALQLESVVYACQRHLQMLPDGSRGGFFIGRLPSLGWGGGCVDRRARTLMHDPCPTPACHVTCACGGWLLMACRGLFVLQATARAWARGAPSRA